MPQTPSPLQITYASSDLYRLDDERLAAAAGRGDVVVPAPDDEGAASSIAAMLLWAVARRVIAEPPGVSAVCFPDDDPGGAGVVLAVRSTQQLGLPYVTTGWLSVTEIVGRTTVGRGEREGQQLRRALAALVGQLNAPLVTVSLAARAVAAGLRAEDLDELVHDRLAAQASDVNNGGLPAQIALLIDTLGEERASAALATLVAGRRRA